MKAIVLAAGLGTRLRPLTDDRPKALVEVGGQTMLERVLRRLARFGVTQVIVNVHHHAQLVVDYLATHHNFGLHIEISREDDLLLDTGGGLKQTAEFFLREGGNEPFLLHNVDIASTVDLNALLAAHRASGALVTLAVKARASSRQLLFDADGLLCGRRAGQATEWARECSPVEPLAYSCIQAISPRLFPLLKGQGGQSAFPIFPAYLRMAAEGERIAAFRVDQAYWRDLGKIESIRQAEADLTTGLWA